jgi:hypothetical protein
MKYGQPMISRETRRLLITIAISIASLWVLARIRFQDQPGPAAAVAPVLAQLRPAATYADLAQTVADLRPAVAAAITTAGHGVALRIAVDRAVTLSPDAASRPLALDRATGLAVVEIARSESTGVMPWAPRVLDFPRYLLIAEHAAGGVALRPVFVSTMAARSSPAWRGEIWTLAPATSIPPGSFVFTVEGALAGMSVSDRDATAIVPASLLLTSARRLADEPARLVGVLGTSVQPLTADLGAVVGARAGVIVTGVDPEGPAAELVKPTDVIEAIDGHEIESIEHWQARIARVVAGQTVALRVRAGGTTRDVQIVAAEPARRVPEIRDSQLGLELSIEPRIGARVTSVEPNASADRALLRAGDIITAVGRETAPRPAQVHRAFASLPPDGSMIVAFTRGSEHHLAVISKHAGEGQR